MVVESPSVDEKHLDPDDSSKRRLPVDGYGTQQRGWRIAGNHSALLPFDGLDDHYQRHSSRHRLGWRFRPGVQVIVSKVGIGNALRLPLRHLRSATGILWDRMRPHRKGGGRSMRGRRDPQAMMSALVDLEERVPEGRSPSDHQGRGRRGVGAPVSGGMLAVSRLTCSRSRCRLNLTACPSTSAATVLDTAGNVSTTWLGWP